MPTNAPFISFERVQKRFGPKVIYEDLTMGIERGETFVVIGGSGSGKSVMLKMLIGLLSADAGKICVDGVNVVGLNETELLPVRKRISMLFQGGALFDSITVGENVAYPLRENGSLPESEITDKVEHTLERVGLAGTAHQRPSDLSGGMKKRAALARAIVAEPECILYDEPTTGLDPLNTRRIGELILKIQEDLKVTSIVVTHDMQCAFLVADRLAMLHERKVQLVAPAKEFENTKDPVVREFIHAMQSPAADGAS